MRNIHMRDIPTTSFLIVMDACVVALLIAILSGGAGI